MFKSWLTCQVMKTEPGGIRAQLANVMWRFSWSFRTKLSYVRDVRAFSGSDGLFHFLFIGVLHS